MAALQREREALEAGVLDMSGKTVALDRWLADNEAKIPEGGHTSSPVLLSVCSSPLIPMMINWLKVFDLPFQSSAGRTWPVTWLLL